MPRHFPPRWKAEKIVGGGYVVRDAIGLLALTDRGRAVFWAMLPDL